MTILDRILETKRQEVAFAKTKKTYEEILSEARNIDRAMVSFSKAITGSRTGIIAEFKRKSPSKGFIKEDAKVKEIVRSYADNGAAAISVLTDSDYFAGSLDDLRQARAATAIPLLRKDFVIDPYQLCEARIAGADAVLLIAAALSAKQCEDLAGLAVSLGLEVLLELHKQTELTHISPFVSVIGINNRNLATFETDINTSIQLSASLPSSFIRISESGISLPESVKQLQKNGFKGFLMGENFMKQEDPGEALRGFIKELER